MSIPEYYLQFENFKPQNVQAENELLCRLYAQKLHELLLLKQRYKIVSEEYESQAAGFQETCQETSLVRAELEKVLLQSHIAELKEKLTEIELNDNRSKEELHRLKSGLKKSQMSLARLSEL
jgi:hypothetical protein